MTSSCTAADSLLRSARARQTRRRAPQKLLIDRGHTGFPIPRRRRPILGTSTSVPMRVLSCTRRSCAGSTITSKASIPGSRRTPVKIFVMGENVWRDEREWRSRAPLHTILPPQSGTGQQSPRRRPNGIDGTDGRTPGSLRLRPDDPVPTCGGNIIIPMGVQDQRQWKRGRMCWSIRAPQWPRLWR